MDLSHTLVLGLIAGGTIVLGLPIGRLRRPSEKLRLLLTASAIGVLLFLVWDVLSAAWEPVDTALAAVHEHTGGLAPVLRYGALFAGGITAGLLLLVAYGLYMQRARTPRFGPGAMAVAEARHISNRAWSPARRTALMIAVGIGLHNFAEGLAIGQSAARNETALATLLVIGFGLHNATEGFGIVAPLAAEKGASDDGRPSWALLLALGLVAGGPPLLGTLVGLPDRSSTW